MADAARRLPPDPATQTLRTLVERYLSQYLYSNATFLAERLYAHSRTEENLHLLATCHVRAGQPQSAYSLLRAGIGGADGWCGREVAAANRYLLARCCFDLGKLLEAESALLHGTDVPSKGLHACSEALLSECAVPNGAAGLYLLGQICARDDRREHAVEYFGLALKLDPFLWDAYEQLCSLGAELPPSAVFGVPTLPAACATKPAASDDDAMHIDGAAALSETPLRRLLPRGDKGVAAPLPVPMPPERASALGMQPPPPYFYVSDVAGASEAQATAAAAAAAATTPPTSKSTRLGGVLAAEPSTRGGSWVLATTPAQGWPTPAPAVSAMVQAQQRQAGSAHPLNVVGSLEVLGLLGVLGEVTLLLSLYRCKEALEILAQLPERQRRSGWIKHQEGLAHFERADYAAARASFECMRTLCPHRTDGLAVFSTNLWHLKSEAALCYLAQAAVEVDKLSPEAWCVVGNCFSLQKEHDVAIRFFTRALRLDPTFTYAYTLSGHEYVANEDFEKAVSCYRHAIRVDPRHYNAWYGLGTIYYRQEKFQMAEYHFRRALDINPRSSVLYCYLGMVLHACGKFNEALASLEQAATLEPTNPQAKFQRAAASVYFIMGKIYKQLGRRDEAMTHFTTALDLDPKDTNLIKAAIDKLDSSDLDEEDEL